MFQFRWIRVKCYILCVVCLESVGSYNALYLLRTQFSVVEIWFLYLNMLDKFLRLYIEGLYNIIIIIIIIVINVSRQLETIIRVWGGKKDSNIFTRKRRWGQRVSRLETWRFDWNTYWLNHFLWSFESLQFGLLELPLPIYHCLCTYSLRPIEFTTFKFLMRELFRRYATNSMGLNEYMYIYYVI